MPCFPLRVEPPTVPFDMQLASMPNLPSPFRILFSLFAGVSCVFRLYPRVTVSSASIREEILSRSPGFVASRLPSDNLSEPECTNVVIYIIARIDLKIWDVVNNLYQF